MTVARRLADLGLTLPAPPAPRGDYVPVVVHDSVAYVSGQLSRDADGIVRGPADADTPQEDITRAAQACVLRALSALEQVLGSLDAVERILHLRGFVSARPDFENHSAVLDAASGLLREIFGDRGRHARSAIGVGSLPGGGLLEIELTVAVAAETASAGQPKS